MEWRFCVSPAEIIKTLAAGSCIPFAVLEVREIEEKYNAMDMSTRELKGGRVFF